MDWSHKFSSIIKETESNLAKVKERLHSAQSSDFITETKDSPLMNLYTGNSPHGVKTTYTASALISPYSKQSTLAVAPYNPYKSLPNDSYLNNHETLQNDTTKFDLGNTPSTGMITLLHDKIDAQNKTIETLLHTVKKLEQERDDYFRQVKELRDDIAQLTNRVMERGIDIQTERKIDQWKQDVSSQMLALQTQIRTVSNWNEKNGSYHDNQTTSVIRDLHELKRFVSTECDGLKYSIESVKNRLGRLEVDLNSTSIENRSIAQRQNFIDTNIRTFMDVQTTPPLFNSRPTSDVHQLKSSIDNIRDKLSYMENDLRKSHSFTASGTRHKKRTKRRKKPVAGSVDIFSPETSDLDLSDSIDLGNNSDTVLSYGSRQRHYKSDALSLNNTVGLSADDLNDTRDGLDDVRTAELDDVITANTLDLNLTDDDGLDDVYLENDPVNDHELSIDELN